MGKIGLDLRFEGKEGSEIGREVELRFRIVWERKREVTRDTVEQTLFCSWTLTMLHLQLFISPNLD